MQQEIYLVIIIGIILGVLLVAFIVNMLFRHQRQQQKQEQEMERMKAVYEKEVLRSQLEIQENTFKTISQELHDNIGQMLSVVKLSLSVMPVEPEHQAYPAVLNAQKVLNKAIFDLSNLTKSLHSDRIAQINLTDSIFFELDNVQKAGILQVVFNVDGEEVQFDDQKGVFLFRMFQEILNNALKHSQATQMTVNLVFTETIFTLEIIDNGVGFDVDEKKQSASSESGVGLKSLFNRAKLIGADLNMLSAPGEGTTVIIKMALTEGH